MGKVIRMFSFCFHLLNSHGGKYSPECYSVLFLPSFLSYTNNLLLYLLFFKTNKHPLYIDFDGISLCRLNLFCCHPSFSQEHTHYIVAWLAHVSSGLPLDFVLCEMGNKRSCKMSKNLKLKCFNRL